MADLVFNSAVARANGKAITFTLDERKYKFHPPKTAAIFMSADDSPGERVRVQLNWLSAGLSEEDAKTIHDRLMDFDDPLTPGTLLEVVGALIEEASGRPTGPSPG
jgi:hypothetical protein